MSKSIPNGSETHGKGGKQEGPVKVPPKTQKRDIFNDTKKGTVQGTPGIYKK